MFLGKDVLKICSKFTGEKPCRSIEVEGCFLKQHSFFGGVGGGGVGGAGGH